ncbi:Thiamine-monophosphate kinase [Bibersteinia trehalosi USDA-ARS-USMARC-188]|uniref:Thiamine-monophosphate kinase n=1 Tax=Bibersteinia trehalosi USDA-ARS-USMARC-188 TaxID=1263829 RepID=A0A4V7I854_BIBTR|nr:thiamine-phosphate kinase [Bibersteinia trehalosi]AHG81162.1 Thiamine-monophosphate kinase [Bibersteinia trehalosi USDA-ARS-USMARC-188]
MGEFDLIEHYFSRHKHLLREDIIYSVGDDCAVTCVPKGHQLAMSTDTLVCGTHFLETINPSDLAYKSLAVNLSDLAAQGAKPAWISLALTLPTINPVWLESFSQSFFATLSQFQTALIGGDTTKGPLSLTLTAQGFLPTGKGLFRHKAKVGDAIFVSGTLGDSAAGLALLLAKQRINNTDQQYLLHRHLRPTPRVALGQALLTNSQCALDISDGLLADLRHILKASQCGAEIYVENLPLSSALTRSYKLEQAEQFALTGGEDYELCFTVPVENIAEVKLLAKQLHTPCTQIGVITAPREQISLLKHHKPYHLPSSLGFDHFG